MRKRYKEKKRSCALCKPHKRTWSKRWTLKDMITLEEFEHLKKQSIDNNKVTD